MNVNYQHFQVLMIALILILFFGVVFCWHSNSNLSQEISNNNYQYVRLERQKHKSQNQHTVVHRRTVPSDYKNMVSDAKQVCHAEDFLSMRDQYAPKSKAMKRKLSKNGKLYKQNYGIMQNLTTNQGTDWNITEAAWLDVPQWHLSFVPGSSGDSSTYSGTFLALNKKNNIMGMVTAEYDPQDRQFHNFQKYSTTAGTNVNNLSMRKSYPHGWGQ